MKLIIYIRKWSYKNMRLRRLQWMGHMMRMDECVPKKALKQHTEGRRPVGRPKGRWIHAMDTYARKILKFKNWRKLAEDREVWRWRTKSKLGCSTTAEEEYFLDYR
jgi:hypothetical protein